MLHRIATWIRFYRPIFMLSILGALGFLVMSGMLLDEMNYTFLKLTFVVLSPLVHFVYYEFLRPQEYYYFRNLQWSKRELWMVTSLLALLLALW